MALPARPKRLPIICSSTSETPSASCSISQVTRTCCPFSRRRATGTSITPPSPAVRSRSVVPAPRHPSSADPADPSVVRPCRHAAGGAGDLSQSAFRLAERPSTATSVHPVKPGSGSHPAGTWRRLGGPLPWSLDRLPQSRRNVDTHWVGGEGKRASTGGRPNDLRATSIVAARRARPPMVPMTATGAGLPRLHLRSERPAFPRP
jgi:hypothetical protein